MPRTATPSPTTGPAVWKAAAPVAAVAAALPEAEPVAERLWEAVLVPETAVTEAELDAEPDAEPDAAAEAEEEAEALEFEAPQSGLVFRVTPAPLQRVSAKEMVAEYCISSLKSVCNHLRRLLTLDVVLVTGRQDAACNLGDG